MWSACVAFYQNVELGRAGQLHHAAQPITKAITLRQALQAVHQPRATVVLVGDREYDVHAAWDKGIDSTECYGTHADLIGAGPHLATDATDVERIVLAT